MAKTTLAFEVETCPRCGGSGKHSYCEMHGDTCFKCTGHGVVLTKRGLAAQVEFNRLCSKHLSELKAGDHVKLSGGWETVRSVKAGDSNGGGWRGEDGVLHPWAWVIETNVGSLATREDSMVLVAQTVEARRAKLDIALRYQGTLSKSGAVKTKG